MKAKKTETELTNLIFEELSASPVCPKSMTITIERQSDGQSWTAFTNSHQAIAYADCVQLVSQIAARLGRQYDLA